MTSEICLHNATLLNGYSTMENCAVLIKNNKIADVFNESRFKQKNFNPDIKFIDLKWRDAVVEFVDKLPNLQVY